MEKMIFLIICAVLFCTCRDENSESLKIDKN